MGNSNDSNAVQGAGEVTPEVTGSEEAYGRFLPQARELNPRDVIEFRADAALAYHNAKRGVDAILSRESDVKRDLPGVRFDELRQLPLLAQGVIFAAGQVNRDAPSSDATAELLGQAHPLRRKLLTAAIALAEAGLVPEAEVMKIRRGVGKIDVANDCVELAAFFRHHEPAVRGKSPVTEADIGAAARVGSELQTILNPRSTPRDAALPATVATAVDARNRLWTLLIERHDRLWRVGAWLFGREVEENVPALQSRVVPQRKATAPAPGPTAVTAPTTRPA